MLLTQNEGGVCGDSLGWLYPWFREPRLMHEDSQRRRFFWASAPSTPFLQPFNLWIHYTMLNDMVLTHIVDVRFLARRPKPTGHPISQRFRDFSGIGGVGDVEWIVTFDHWSRELQLCF